MALPPGDGSVATGGNHTGALTATARDPGDGSTCVLSAAAADPDAGVEAEGRGIPGGQKLPTPAGAEAAAGMAGGGLLLGRGLTGDLAGEEASGVEGAAWVGVPGWPRLAVGGEPALPTGISGRPLGRCCTGNREQEGGGGCQQAGWAVQKEKLQVHCAHLACITLH